MSVKSPGGTPVLGSATVTGQAQFTLLGTAAIPSVVIKSTLPIFELNDTDAAADEGTVQIFQAGNLFIMRHNNDADNDNRRFLEVQNTGPAITTILFGNSTDNNTYRFQGTGTVRFDGTTTGAQTATFSATNKPGSGTAGPIAWIPVITAAGATGYVPVFGA